MLKYELKTRKYRNLGPSGPNVCLYVHIYIVYRNHFVFIIHIAYAYVFYVYTLLELQKTRINLFKISQRSRI